MEHYEVKLNEIEYSTIREADIGGYNLSDEIFKLYTSPEKYYNSSDPDLIMASNSITENIRYLRKILY